MIGIKDKKVRRQLLEVSYHTILQDVLDWIEDEWPGLTVFTCGYRKGDEGVHGQIPCRAVDLRSKMFMSPETVKATINNYWQYDPTRPGQHKVCKYHQVFNQAGESLGWHFHIQVCDNTIRRTS